MSNLQEQVNTAWYALSNIDLADYCAEDTMNAPRCYLCPEPEKALSVCDRKRAVSLKNWLRNNGFPPTAPHVYTVAELAQQLIKGRSLPCLTQQITQHVEAVTCPGCGKHTLHRERRMVCTGCNSVYPADKWDSGEPCDCGCMDAGYHGIHSANRLGQLEFQRCQTPGCRWAGDYRRLTVQELADAAMEEKDAQWSVARTCPACGGASGIAISKDGVFPAIKSCEYCGWQKHKSGGEEE